MADVCSNCEMEVGDRPFLQINYGVKSDDLNDPYADMFRATTVCSRCLVNVTMAKVVIKRDTPSSVFEYEQYQPLKLAR